jgi:hypothetical protein
MSQIEYKTYLLKFKKKQNKGARGTRDSERAKTYESEWAFQRQFNVPKFNDIKEAQKYAKRIYKSKTWQKLWSEHINEDVTRLFASNPPVVAKLRSSGRGTSGWTNGHTVTLDTKCGLDVYVLLHELTHCLGNMHHGRSFRKDLLSLVSRFLGRDAAKILKGEFRKRKLACGEERKPLSYEQWMSARQRMEKIRNG